MNAVLEKPAEAQAGSSLTCLPRDRIVAKPDSGEVWAELAEFYDLEQGE